MLSNALECFAHLSALRKLSRQCEELIKIYETGEIPDQCILDIFKTDLLAEGFEFLAPPPNGLGLLEDVIFARSSEIESKLVDCTPKTSAEAVAMLEFALLRLRDGELDLTTIEMIERSVGVLKAEQPRP